jgi:hypothetical protein
MKTGFYHEIRGPGRDKLQDRMRMDWTMRNIVFVLAQSVKRCFPSGAAIFNCPIFSDTST